MSKRGCTDHAHGCNMCHSIVALTAQASLHHLQDALLQQLKATTSAVHVSTFQVQQEQNKQEQNASARKQSLRLLPHHQPSGYDPHHDPHQLAHETPLQRAIQQHTIEHQHDHLHRYFMPVTRKQDRLDLWVLDYRDALTPEEQTRLNLLAEVYTHCDAHISMHRHDSLTGLQNRKALTEKITMLLKSRAQNRRRKRDQDHLPFLAIIDIDFFKRINDTFGHLYGDEVLLLLAGLMKQSFRDNDNLYRYGGEEFVALVDAATEETAMLALDRFRQCVDQYEFPQVGHISVSIGFVALQNDSLPTTLFDRADQALYYAKEHGRNQTCSYQRLKQAGLLADKELNVDSELFE